MTSLAECLLSQLGVPKPDPEVAAVKLGLVLCPAVGAAYSFDGLNVVYDARASREHQRMCIARAVICKVREHRMRELPAEALMGASVRALFELD